MTSEEAWREWRRLAGTEWSETRPDGKATCLACGKVQFPALHSCGGIPRTAATMQRWEAFQRRCVGSD